MKNFMISVRPARGRLRSTWVAAAAIVGAVVLGACSSQGPAGAGSPDRSAAGNETHPIRHIHGIGIDPADDTLVIATHDGLLAMQKNGKPQRRGPVIDLMGFAVTGPGHFYASGHPGVGVDLPQPVGLIESTDGGVTWKQLSRQGKSDFHALTASRAGVLGYDGSLLRSADGKQWQEATIPAEPAALAASPDGATVLAATRQGPLRSIDSGTTWSPVPGAPLLQVLHWAADASTVAALDPAGTVWASTDAGVTWQQRAQLGAAPQAIFVDTAGDAPRVIVATKSAILESRDSGRTFGVLFEL